MTHHQTALFNPFCMAPIVDCVVFWGEFQYIKPEIGGSDVKHRLLDLRSLTSCLIEVGS